MMVCMVMNMGEILYCEELLAACHVICDHRRSTLDPFLSRENWIAGVIVILFAGHGSGHRFSLPQVIRYLRRYDQDMTYHKYYSAGTGWGSFVVGLGMHAGKLFLFWRTGAVLRVWDGIMFMSGN
jgi:hypothetical protein